MTSWTFYGDYSKWNGACPSDVPWPILCFRVDTGYDIDVQAANYWRLFKSKPHIRMALAYVVPIPGKSAEILARVKQFFGPQCPPNLAFMLDEESGAGFAGPGDHSTEWNWLDAQLSAYTRSSKDVEGYANTGDWSSGWPHHRADLKRVVAKYSSFPPSIDFYAWQYSDGDSRWAHHDGFPFVKGLDMNAIPKGIDDVLIDYGFGLDWLDMATADDVRAAVRAELEAADFFSWHDRANHGLDTTLRLALTDKIAPVQTALADPTHGAIVQIAALQKAVASIASVLAALKAEVEANHAGTVKLDPVSVSGTVTFQ